MVVVLRASANERLESPTPKGRTPKQARDLIRAGALTGQTSNLAPGFVQVNLAILPADWADEFLLFCQRNPKPCPIIAVTQPGEPIFRTLGDDVDVRIDVARYKVFRDGALVDEPADLLDIWRDDLVAFAIGCSFSFEEALVEAGLRLRHCDEGRNVPMYRTNLPTQATRRFSGPMVVSMRPFTPRDAIRAIQVTSRFPDVHGAPIHLGDPQAIGIADLSRPDFGDPVTVHQGELPVFWACGVTPQTVIAEARPPLAITHHPGCMLITDLRNAHMAVL